MSGDDVIARLKSDYNFIYIKQKGSHVKLRSLDGKITVTVPLHDELKRKTLSIILKQAQVDKDEFFDCD